MHNSIILVYNTGLFHCAPSHARWFLVLAVFCPNIVHFPLQFCKITGWDNECAFFKLYKCVLLCCYLKCEKSGLLMDPGTTVWKNVRDCCYQINYYFPILFLRMQTVPFRQPVVQTLGEPFYRTLLWFTSKVIFLVCD